MLVAFPVACFKSTGLIGIACVAPDCTRNLSVENLLSVKSQSRLPTTISLCSLLPQQSLDLLGSPLQVVVDDDDIELRLHCHLHLRPVDSALQCLVGFGLPRQKSSYQFLSR